MTMYCIVEIEDGWAIAEHSRTGTSEETAQSRAKLRLGSDKNANC